MLFRKHFPHKTETEVTNLSCSRERERDEGACFFPLPTFFQRRVKEGEGLIQFSPPPFLPALMGCWLNSKRYLSSSSYAKGERGEKRPLPSPPCASSVSRTSLKGLPPPTTTFSSVSRRASDVHPIFPNLICPSCATGVGAWARVYSQSRRRRRVLTGQTRTQSRRREEKGETNE